MEPVSIAVEIAVDRGYLSYVKCLRVGLKVIEGVLPVIDGGDRNYSTPFLGLVGACLERVGETKYLSTVSLRCSLSFDTCVWAN